MVVARRAPAVASEGGGGGRRLETADEAIASVSAGFGGIQKVTLPEGTTTTSHPGYQEVLVPAPKLPPVPGPGDAGLVAIASLEPLAQSAFAGVRHLNRLQSLLFAAAYRSNENLLVCAPVRVEWGWAQMKRERSTSPPLVPLCRPALARLTSPC